MLDILKHWFKWDEAIDIVDHWVNIGFLVVLGGSFLGLVVLTLIDPGQLVANMSKLWSAGWLTRLMLAVNLSSLLLIALLVRDVRRFYRQPTPQMRW